MRLMQRATKKGVFSAFPMAAPKLNRWSQRSRLHGHDVTADAHGIIVSRALTGTNSCSRSLLNTLSISVQCPTPRVYPTTKLFQRLPCSSVVMHLVWYSDFHRMRRTMFLCLRKHASPCPLTFRRRCGSWNRSRCLGTQSQTHGSSGRTHRHGF